MKVNLQQFLRSIIDFMNWEDSLFGPLLMIVSFLFTMDVGLLIMVIMWELWW
jgi:hypothetical protein